MIREVFKKYIYNGAQSSTICKIKKKNNSISNKRGQHFGNVDTRQPLKTQVAENTKGHRHVRDVALGEKCWLQKSIISITIQIYKDLG